MCKIPVISFSLLLILLPRVIFAESSESSGAREFVPLFNGVNLVGWTVSQGHGKDWTVENGELVVRGRSSGAAGAIRTARAYRDFELGLDFKVSPGGNSGVFIRMGENDAGLEIQLLDDYATKHENLQDWQYTGALYGLAGPATRVSKPAGEWQTMTIRLHGQDLEVKLNGASIVQADLERFVPDQQATDGETPLTRKEGFLGLQNYGDEVRFRNIVIHVPVEEAIGHN